MKKKTIYVDALPVLCNGFLCLLYRKSGSFISPLPPLPYYKKKHTHTNNKKTNRVRPPLLRYVALLRPDDREENVVEDLDGVDVQEALLRRYELEVDRVGQGPHRPRAHHPLDQVALDLVDDLAGGVARRDPDPREEDQGEDGRPEDLVNHHLGGQITM